MVSPFHLDVVRRGCSWHDRETLSLGVLIIVTSISLMDSMEAEFSLTDDQRECIEQLSRFLREGIGKLTALSERVADGDIVVLC
ncbi:hypothetical protein APA94_32480 [Pseudomonas aeruginosa]|nr:hypothetical protein APA94_32480 [Pseudomonas aeruginosa]